MRSDKKYRLTGRRKPSPFISAVLLWLPHIFAVLIFAAAVTAFALWGVPLIERAIALPVPKSCSPASPAIAAPDATLPSTPDAAVHPLYFTDLTATQHEWVINDKPFFADVSVFRDKDGDELFVCAAGRQAQRDGSPLLDTVVVRNPALENERRISVPLKYVTLRFPLLLDDDTLVYFDMQTGGGGRIVAYSIADGSDKTLKIVHMGVPKLSGAGHYIAWTERTGSKRYKLFMCDVVSGETVTVDSSESVRFGVFAPVLTETELYYVNALGEAWVLSLNNGQTRPLPTVGVVTALSTNGLFIAFTVLGNENGDSLYLIDSKGDVLPISDACVGFALCDKFLVYNVRQRNYVYFLSDGYTFGITRESDKSLFLAAGGRGVVWQNVSWRERDIVEYMIIED